MSGGRRYQHGLSLLEFTLVVIIFGILVVLAFERIAALRADMERATVRHTVGAMQATLALEFAARVSAGRVEDVGGLVGSNVLELMDPPPAGYDPGRDQPDWRRAPPGTWFYDSARGAVVYRAEHEAALPAAGPAAGWRAVAQGDDRDGNGTVDPGREPVSGLGLERIPFRATGGGD